ncbi:hypothetical protein CLOM_g16268 [Closterium sp. NIES-68]|nr:hypothetical protein CLOM_g16268 [Closterium sp. NIES-68]
MWSPEADSAASPPEPEEWVDSPGPGSEVSRSHWMPEEAFKRCTNPACAKDFSHRRRKHHCRCCGNVYCSKCTSYVLPLNPHSAMIESGGVKAKVCELCYETALNEGFAGSPGSMGEGEGEAGSSMDGADEFGAADSQASTPAAHSAPHAAAAKPSGLASHAARAASPDSILASSPSAAAHTAATSASHFPSSPTASVPRPSSAGPSTLPPPASLEEDIFVTRPRLRAQALLLDPLDHRPHSSGGRMPSFTPAFPRFNSMAGTGGSGSGGGSGSVGGSISIGGTGGRLHGSGGSGDLFPRSSTVSASHGERAGRSGLGMAGASADSSSGYSSFAAGVRSSSSSAVSTSMGDSSRAAGDRVRVLQRYRHLSVSLDEERSSGRGKAASAGAWAAADRAAAAGPQHLDLAGGAGGMGGRGEREQQQQQQQGDGVGSSRGGSGGSMRGGTAGPGNKIGLSLDLLVKMNFTSQPSPSHPSPSQPSSSQPSPSLPSDLPWKRPSPLHSPASALMSPQPFSPSPWMQPGRARGGRGSADVLVIADRGAEGEGEAEAEWDLDGGGMAGGGKPAMEVRRRVGIRGEEAGGASVEDQEREGREREERERAEGEQRRRDELYEQLGAALTLESPSAHVKGGAKSVQLHDLLAAWEKGESVLDAPTTVSPLPAVSPLPPSASPLTLLASISHRMGLTPTPAPAAPAIKEAEATEGGAAAQKPGKAEGAGREGTSAEAIQRLLWTEGEPRAVPATAAAAAAAAWPAEASPESAGQGLEEVKRRLADSMGAAAAHRAEGPAAGDGAAAHTAASPSAPGAEPGAQAQGSKAPGAEPGAKAQGSKAPDARAAPDAAGGAPSSSPAKPPSSLLQWSSSDVLHWLQSSVPFRSNKAKDYAGDFEKAGVEGLSLVSMTRGHPALANMRPADLVAFELASQVERRRVVAAEAAGQAAAALMARPATAVGVPGVDAQQLKQQQPGQQQQQAGQPKFVPPRQFRALHLDGFSTASSRTTTPSDTPQSTASRLPPARPATAAAGSAGGGSGGGLAKGTDSSSSGGGWLFGWSSGAAKKDSPAAAEGGEAVSVRDEAAAAEEREETAKAKLSRLDEMLKRSLLVEYLHTRQRWAPMGGEVAIPVDDPEAEDEWLPRFVALSNNEVSCYRQASDLEPEVSIPLDSVAAAGSLEAGMEAGEEAEDWLVFHLTTGYGLRLECATRSRVKLQLWLATIHEAVENVAMRKRRGRPRSASGAR